MNDAAPKLESDEATDDDPVSSALPLSETVTRIGALTPSPDTPREGWGGGDVSGIEPENPHPNPPPEYRGREEKADCPKGDIFAPVPRLPLPSDAGLARGLARVFGGPVTLRERSEFVSTSTYPAELLTLESDGVVHQVLCKYSAGRDDHRCWGHRGGLDHEARVYQHVLRPLGVTEPACHGAYEDPESGWTWLVLEYLDDAVRIHQVEDSDTNMMRAAAWLGAFHAAGQDRLPATGRRCLSTYDANYYEGWIRRTLEYSAPLRERFPWFADFCGRAMQLLAPLLDRPATVIHGEFYIKNILYARGRVCPVDWESAALGAGEIDLTSLVESWSPETTDACIRAYCRARWPGGAPADFRGALVAAEAYLLFRWLGGEPEYAGLARAHWRYGRLFELGRQAGLIPASARPGID
jgi:aminoglycoside phosphotransferase (APT) family kinase protein